MMACSYTDAHTHEKKISVIFFSNSCTYVFQPLNMDGLERNRLQAGTVGRDAGGWYEWIVYLEMLTLIDTSSMEKTTKSKPLSMDCVHTRSSLADFMADSAS